MPDKSYSEPHGELEKTLERLLAHSLQIHRCDSEKGELVSLRTGRPLLGEVHKGYLRVRVMGRWVRLHRLIYAHHHGRWPRQQLDHINGNRADNRIVNLRECAAVENARNRPLLPNRKPSTRVKWHAWKAGVQRR